MNASSEKRLSQLMPEFARRVRLIVERLAIRGFVVEVVQGLRTFAEQDMLYAQGRTRKGPKVTNAKGGQGLHCYAVATDFALLVNGKLGWPDPHPVWKAIGEEAKKVGLEAGVYWKSPDQPHVECPVVDWRELLAAFKKGGMEAAWKLAAGYLKPFKETV